jgi:hypothetical protein
VAADAPTGADDADAGYSIGSVWVETTSDPDVAYICIDTTPDDAVWITIADTDTDDQTLQEAFNQGKTIYNANSLANALRVGIDDGDGNCNEAGESCRAFYSDAALGSITTVIPDGHIISDIPNTFAAVWRYNGTQILEFNSTTIDFASAYGQRISFPWDAGGVNTDGTNCAEPSEEPVNSGPKIWNFGCANSGVFYGKFRLRSAIDASATLTFTLAVRTIGTTSTVFDGDVSMSCRGADDTINNTWGTGVACNITTGTSANLIKECTASAITPNGTCAAGDWIFWRYVIDNANNTATASTAKVLGGLLSVVHSKLGE